jgi:hypothetical protein
VFFERLIEFATERTRAEWSLANREPWAGPGIARADSNAQSHSQTSSPGREAGPLTAASHQVPEPVFWHQFAVAASPPREQGTGSARGPIASEGGAQHVVNRYAADAKSSQRRLR